MILNKFVDSLSSTVDFWNINGWEAAMSGIRRTLGKVVGDVWEGGKREEEGNDSKGVG
jgi:hypothetical protein